MNLTGHVFGSLTVTKPAERNKSLCRCNCGHKLRSSLKVANAKLLRGEVTHCTSNIHALRQPERISP